MKMKKWNDEAIHKAGCPYKGVAVYGDENDMARYYSGYCPGCSTPVKWIMKPPVEENEIPTGQ